MASWLVYTNPTYNFSLNHPADYAEVAQNDDWVEIGPRLVVRVSTTDPTDLRGDGPIFETKEDVSYLRYPAKRYTGYIGAVGGYIPQQYRMYVFHENGVYVIVTLYALGLHATDGDLSQVVPMKPGDDALIDLVAASVEFH
jgi:hypothetical protein